MKRAYWMALGLVITVAAGAQATARPAKTPPARAYDIVTQDSIPANTSCGHYAWDNGNGIWGLDWAVNGVVVEENAQSGINYLNDGSPYTVAFGEVSGGVFTEWYSEMFYPQANNPNAPPPACLEL
jgi:hypothetical protein